MIGLRANVVSAIAGKELRSYLGNPTGYVFLTLFIGTSAAAAFLDDGFFGRNLADLATLNRYIAWILMFFVPAITMSTWSDERRAGTDELLLTLPVRDGEVVLGKYLGALGIYSVGLVFSLANLAVLLYLGEPDMGLIFATYLGYWLMGGLFVAVGMVGSMFTDNATVAFILGALGCAALVFAGAAPWAAGLIGVVAFAGLAALLWLVGTGRARGAGVAGLIGGVLGLGAWLGDVWAGFTEAIASISALAHLAWFGEGIVRLGDIAYFVGGAVIALVLCSLLLNRRHW
ncbi:MAG: ABC-2 transporter permease [Myxococcales bacterium]|nr:ABC-2 transporter permease [Myxococcales bacterium]